MNCSRQFSDIYFSLRVSNAAVNVHAWRTFGKKTQLHYNSKGGRSSDLKKITAVVDGTRRNVLCLMTPPECDKRINTCYNAVLAA